VSGSIELVRPLASGGMGQVWLAEHRGLDIQVAVKFMRREVADDPVSLSRFEQEAKLAARIKSPHVVEVFDYDVTDTGIPFIVMESLRGRDLETVLQNGKSLGVSDAARVLVHVCKALAKAHSVGVIHRDIKAENVFVVQEEDGGALIKVLDFGVAKETSVEHGISLSGTTVGTPAYMSPEQLFHPKEADHRTDLWATAVLVYRCLTGSFPFEGESFASVCLSVSKGKFAPPSALNGGLPAGLDAWFKKAFHKNLAARFSSAREMKDAFLDELRQADLLPPWAEPGQADVAPSSSGPSSGWAAPRSVPRSRVRRTRVAQIGAAMMGLLLVGAVGLPTRAKALGLAAVAGEHAYAWAAHAGFYPALTTDDDAPASMTERVGATEVRWLPPPSALALAERDGEAGRTEGLSSGAVRSDRAGYASSDVLRLVRFDAPAPPVAGNRLNVSEAQPSGLELDPYAVKTPSASPQTNPAVAAPTTPPADLATVRFGL
jgi:tRNA A-37 threonylcarbamoyl transferase component Bud32